MSRASTAATGGSRRKKGSSRGGSASGASGPRIKDYASALEYLDGRIDVERMRPTRVDRSAFKLDRMRALLERLEHPEFDSKFVHVAGSKGKGSVVEMLASCLGACGYATGVFTSPHLVDVRERIRVGERWIDESSFAALVDRCASAAGGLEPSLGEPTYFELLTAVALLHFAEQAVDLAIMEVGLGGRLDSTNVITPEVCAIASIQLEHTAILGDTLEAIAREKAGIIKPGVPVVSVRQAEEASGVLRAVAAERGAPLRVLGDEGLLYTSRFVSSPQRGPHMRVCVSSEARSYDHMPVPLMGHHQAENAGLVLAVLDRLHERGFAAPEPRVERGMARTPARGRLERVWDAPRIYVDGAHTPESLEQVVKGIGSHLRYDSMVVVFGCAADKDLDAMLAKLAIGADKVIFTRSSRNPRAAEPGELQRRFAEVSPKMTQTAPTLKEGINMAHRAVGREDVICVTGSFYLAGEAKALLTEARAKHRAG